MNIHHLELFYYVARHGGIAESVRHMPYGIQQPAISSQVIQLEESLGITLFQRRPFALTKAGSDLYEFARPFFENVMPMAEKLQGGVAQQLRIAASETVLRDHLPAILNELRKSFPKLRVTLREGYHPDVEGWLQRQEIDLSLGLIGSKTAAGIKSIPMFQLPLVLLVPASSKLKSAEELWKRDRIEEALITVPRNERITRTFQEGLAKRKVDWFSGIEVNSVEMVQTYVANGYGFGVTVLALNAQLHPQVRQLPLNGFDVVTFGVLWQGRRKPLLDALLKLLDAYARRFVGGVRGSVLLLK